MEDDILDMILGGPNKHTPSYGASTAQFKATTLSNVPSRYGQQSTTTTTNTGIGKFSLGKLPPHEDDHLQEAQRQVAQLERELGERDSDGDEDLALGSYQFGGPRAHHGKVETGGQFQLASVSNQDQNLNRKENVIDDLLNLVEEAQSGVARKQQAGAGRQDQPQQQQQQLTTKLSQQNEFFDDDFETSTHDLVKFKQQQLHQQAQKQSSLNKSPTEQTQPSELEKKKASLFGTFTQKQQQQQSNIYQQQDQQSPVHGSTSNKRESNLRKSQESSQAATSISGAGGPPKMSFAEMQRMKRSLSKQAEEGQAEAIDVLDLGKRKLSAKKEARPYTSPTMGGLVVQGQEQPQPQSFQAIQAQPLQLQQASSSNKKGKDIINQNLIQQSNVMNNNANMEMQQTMRQELLDEKKRVLIEKAQEIRDIHANYKEIKENYESQLKSALAMQEEQGKREKDLREELRRDYQSQLLQQAEMLNNVHASQIQRIQQAHNQETRQMAQRNEQEVQTLKDQLAHSMQIHKQMETALLQATKGSTNRERDLNNTLTQSQIMLGGQSSDQIIKMQAEERSKLEALKMKLEAEREHLDRQKEALTNREQSYNISLREEKDTLRKEYSRLSLLQEQLKDQSVDNKNAIQLERQQLQTVQKQKDSELILMKQEYLNKYKQFEVEMALFEKEKQAFGEQTAQEHLHLAQDRQKVQEQMLKLNALENELLMKQKQLQSREQEISMQYTEVQGKRDRLLKEMSEFEKEAKRVTGIGRDVQRQAELANDFKKDFDLERDRLERAKLDMDAYAHRVTQQQIINEQQMKQIQEQKSTIQAMSDNLFKQMQADQTAHSGGATAAMNMNNIGSLTVTQKSNPGMINNFNLTQQTGATTNQLKAFLKKTVKDVPSTFKPIQPTLNNFMAQQQQYVNNKQMQPHSMTSQGFFPQAKENSLQAANTTIRAQQQQQLYTKKPQPSYKTFNVAQYTLQLKQLEEGADANQAYLQKEKQNMLQYRLQNEDMMINTIRNSMMPESANSKQEGEYDNEEGGSNAGYSSSNNF